MARRIDGPQGSVVPPIFTRPTLRADHEKIGSPTARFAAHGLRPHVPDPACCRTSLMTLSISTIMEANMTLQLHYTGTNNSAYLDALEIAERRAPHSYFNQHIIAERDDRFIAIDEGDYNALPAHLGSRVVHTIPGGMHDEF